MTVSNRQNPSSNPVEQVFRLDGRVAVVTGAGRGIGRAIAEALAAAGASVAAVDRTWDGVAPVNLPGCLSLTADVTDPGDVAAAADAARDALGPVTILVNNAGIDNRIPLIEMEDSDWAQMIAVNLTGVFNFTREAVPGMIEAGFGRIINIGSNLGMLGSAGFAHYCAAKGGVHSFTKAIARELAPSGITANVIAPGPIATPLLSSLPQDAVQAKIDEVPLGRAGDPVTEIAPTAVLLASKAGGYYTGAILNASGGDVMA